MLRVADPNLIQYFSNIWSKETMFMQFIVIVTVWKVYTSLSLPGIQKHTK